MREVETQQRSRVIKLLPHLAEHLQRWQTRVTDFFIDKITFSYMTKRLLASFALHATHSLSLSLACSPLMDFAFHVTRRRALIAYWLAHFPSPMNRQRFYLHYRPNLSSARLSFVGPTRVFLFFLFLLLRFANDLSDPRTLDAAVIPRERFLPERLQENERARIMFVRYVYA